MTRAAELKKRILFVDDEPAVLAGLQAVLRRDSRRWDIVFAVGAAHALEELRRNPFDAVVSDFRMPGIDGATLLLLVWQECPRTARIMLTGDVDDAALFAVRPALHTLLFKPCGIGAIRDAIERGLITHKEDAAMR